MVDLSPLLEKFVELMGYSSELDDAVHNDEGVNFYLPCRGGYLCCYIELQQDENLSGDKQCLLLNVTIWPTFGDGVAEIFDLTKLDPAERHEEKIQNQLVWSSLLVNTDDANKRYPGFRRIELLDPKFDFAEQDHDRLVAILGSMIHEVNEVFPQIVALSQGHPELCGHMILTMPVGTNTNQ